MTAFQLELAGIGGSGDTTAQGGQRASPQERLPALPVLSAMGNHKAASGTRLSPAAPENAAVVVFTGGWR